jgi:glycosyltransferase involved in cell wall biosynthesis
MLASVFPPSIGGIQSHTLRLGQELVDGGGDVHVVTRIQPGVSRFERMGGVRVHRVGLARARGAAGSAAFIAEALRCVLALAGAGRVQVLHAHQLLSPATVGLLAAPLTRLPLIVNPHACGRVGDVGILSGTVLGRVRLRAVIERADAFVAVSRRIREELLAAGAPPLSIWDIPNGVDTDRFSPAQASEKEMTRRALGLPQGPLAVFVGRLAPEKGVDVLVRAWPQLLGRVPGARLCIVGTGSEEPRLRALARALHVEESVLFAGGASNAAPHTRAADLAVLPSRSEGMPVALLEAMSCAVPVVATRVGGSAEVLEQGVTGTLVPPDRPAAIAEAMAEVFLGGRAAARRAEASRAYELAHHSIRAVTDRYLALYEGLARGRQPRRALGLASRSAAG